MKILFDNVDFSSSSGPNSFGIRLAKELSYMGHQLSDGEDADVQLSFIHATKLLKDQEGKQIPIFQRLDGIWFNNRQNWKDQNKPIKYTYDISKGVIFQSSFNKRLTEKFFGVHQNSEIIHNGTNIGFIENTDPMQLSFQVKGKIYVAASSWRPHKRLSENIRYFFEHSTQDDILVIAGQNSESEMVSDPRVFYAGNLQYRDLVSLYKIADYFIHLAWLDHCPNVVVNARACGAKIICSSQGGTREIAGEDAIVIDEPEWDFEPCDLYNPPKLDFSQVISNSKYSNISYNIRDAAKKYVEFFKK